MTTRTIIRVVDLETTGFEPPEAGVCEIGWCDVVAIGVDLCGDPCDWIVKEGEFLLCNPGCPIPPETSAIHHIIDDDVSWAPDFRSVIGGIVSDPAVEYLAAHNAKFERQFIASTPWTCPAPFCTACAIW